jgi:hypothetical protein
MNTEILDYKGNVIEFSFDREKENMMVNVTEMAEIFGKDVRDFMILKQTKDFISEALKEENSPFLNIEKETDLIVSVQKSGTWMHRVLALKFAAWLSPAFELWMYRTVENLLFSNYAGRVQSFERTIKMRNRMEELEFKPDKTVQDFEEYLNLNNQLKCEIVYRRSLTVKSIRELEQMSYLSLK